MSDICSKCKNKYGGLLNPINKANHNQLTQLKKFGIEEDNFCQTCAATIISANVKQERDTQQVWVQDNIDSQLSEEYIKALKKIFQKFKVYSSSSYEGENIGFITGYSTLGTGIFTEIVSSFTDMFGVQSSTYKNKLLESEQEAKNDLILKAINLGATAIYNARFSVTEATAGKGILIVHFSGDAIRENSVDSDFMNFFALKEKNAS